MDRWLLLSVGVAGVGLVLLAAMAAAHEPRPIPITDVPKREGQRVCVESHVAHARTTSSGGARLLLVSENSSLSLWSPFVPSAVPGDRVLACGEVRATGVGPELRAERPSDVRVTRPWRDIDVTLDRLARAPWEWRDQHVTVEAHVHCARHACRMEDPRTGAAFPLAGPALPGFQRVEGLLEYDVGRAAFRLRVA